MAEKLTARLIGGAGGAVTKVADILISADAWHGGDGKWSQVVDVPESSPLSKVDLQPTTEQVNMLQSTALTTENVDGIITVYAYGDKPETDLTMQATLTEVVRV